MQLAKSGPLTQITWREPTTAFGALMRQARVARGLSQSRLAKLLEVNHSIISRWEIGNRFPDPASMRGVVRVLDLTDAELMALARAMWREDER